LKTAEMMNDDITIEARSHWWGQILCRSVRRLRRGRCWLSSELGL